MSGSADSAHAARQLMEVIGGGDAAEALRLLDATPALAAEQLGEGATRRSATDNFLPGLARYLYAGDSPLHIAAAAWRPELLRRLIAAGARVDCRNRRGATPLHDAASGNPESARWNPGAQSETITALIDAGADPNAADDNGSTPLRKAIRTRCAAAAEALLRGGADPAMRTRNGSTAQRLASVSSGRGGCGSPRAKAQQSQILELLARFSDASAPSAD
jgi:hypothetical protein